MYQCFSREIRVFKRIRRSGFGISTWEHVWTGTVFRTLRHKNYECIICLCIMSEFLNCAILEVAKSYFGVQV